MLSIQLLLDTGLTSLLPNPKGFSSSSVFFLLLSKPLRQNRLTGNTAILSSFKMAFSTAKGTTNAVSDGNCLVPIPKKLVTIIPNSQLDLSVHRYSFLPPGNIRLLRLMPYEDGLDATVLRCQLFNYPLHMTGGNECLYEALSYVWGGPQKPCSVLINGRTLAITSNLSAALVRLRDRHLERILWVDAICIDQESRVEREEQVRMMTGIYYKASRVLVWLGEGDNNGDLALRQVCAAAQKAGMKSGIHGDDQDSENPPDSSALALLEALLARPWFRRIWVSTYLDPE